MNKKPGKADYRIDEYTLGKHYFVVCYTGGMAVSKGYPTYEEAKEFAKEYFGKDAIEQRIVRNVPWHGER